MKDQPKLAMLEYDTPQDALLAKDFILNVRELKNKGVVIEWGDPKPVAEVTDINVRPTQFKLFFVLIFYSFRI